MLTNSIAPDTPGGLERYVRELAAGLAARGHDITVIAKRVNAEDALSEVAPDGVKIVRCAPPPKSDPLFAARYPVRLARSTERILRSLPPDTVVHAHFPVPALVPLLRRRPYAYTLHAPVYRELLSERQGSYALPPPVQQGAVAALRAVERQLVRKALNIVTLSEFMRAEVSTLDGPSGERVRVIPGGIDSDKFTPDASSTSARSTTGPLLFAARRHVPRTGVQQLVEAMPAVLRLLPEARLVLAGDGGQRSEIERAVDRLHLRSQVRLLGYVDEAELVRWYREADLVVTPTQELEGFGLATAEAMACGTPAIVTPVGANPEVARLLSPTLVASGRDAADLAAAIVGAWGRDGEKARAFKQSARDAVVPRLAWDAVIAEHLAMYRSMAEARDAQGGDAA